jgi:hypothetical protein
MLDEKNFTEENISVPPSAKNNDQSVTAGSPLSILLFN